LEKLGVALMLLGVACGGLALAIALTAGSSPATGVLIIAGGLTFFGGVAASPFDGGPTSGG
jgi:hypothetical protein